MTLNKDQLISLMANLIRLVLCIEFVSGSDRLLFYYKFLMYKTVPLNDTVLEHIYIWTAVTLILE